MQTLKSRLAVICGLRYRHQPPALSSYPVREGIPSSPVTGQSQTPDKIFPRPLVSIITAAHDNAGTLRRTIESVRRQTFADIEHIIVVCGSRDDSFDSIRNNEFVIDRGSADSDRGIYDAFNLGIAHARGELIGLVRSGDSCEPDQIEMAVQAMQISSADWVFGDVWLGDGKNGSLLSPGDPTYQSKIHRTMPNIPLASILTRRALFEKFGLFRTNYRSAADYDWLLRVTRAGAVGYYDPRIVSHMCAGALSTFQGRLAILEGMLISIRNRNRLLDALKHWGIRLLYPDGAPERVKRVLLAALGAFRVIRHRLAGPVVNSGSGVPGHEPSRPQYLRQIVLLQRFVEARHLGFDVDETTLMALAQMGGCYGRPLVLGSEAVIAQVKAALGRAGPEAGDESGQPDLVIVSRAKIDAASKYGGAAMFVIPEVSNTQ